MLSNSFHSQTEKNYQNRSFRGKDLSLEDFSNADIRGCDFSEANLTGANFRGAKAGLSQQGIYRSLLIAAALSGLSGAAATMAVGQPMALMTPKPNLVLPFTVNFIMGLILIFVNAILLISSLKNGLEKTIQNLGITIAVLIPIGGILAALGNARTPILSELRVFRIGYLINSNQIGNPIPALIVTLTASMGATLTVIFTLALAIAIATITLNKIFKLLIIVEALAIGIIASAIVTRNADDRVFEVFSEVNRVPAIITLIALVILSIILATILILVSSNIGKRVLKEEKKYLIIRQFAIAISSWGGTSFVKANLTQTHFNQALLKSTDFTDANIKHTRWYQAEKLEWAKVGNTILENAQVRELLVSLEGYRKTFIGLNLREANLMNANLEYANLRGSDLSEASLETANLEWANLAQTQAIGTNFKEARLTGSYGLSTWNIDSTTNLLWVNCKFIYLLEYPKPGTDDRERRPSSGEFGPDEFTKLFQEAIDTVDLIFREGVDWRAFIYSFKKVQVENSETELTIQRIENKGDGVFIVRVQVPPEADKTKIHQNFTQTYQETLQTLETEYQEKLKIKDSEIANYRERSSNMTEVIRLLASREITQDRKFIKKSPQVAGKLVIFKIIKGDFKTGFTVMLQLGQDGMLPSTEISGSLPPFPELEATYQQWKILYHKLQLPVRISGRKVNLFSSQDVCKDSAKLLEKQLKTWLKSEEFYPLKDRLQQKLNSTDEIRLILQTEHPTLLRLPWQVWEIFEHYPKAEIALSLPQYDQAESVNLNLPRTRVRILAILGNNQDINVHKDRAILQQIIGADVTVLDQPQRLEVDVHLRDEIGWDILFFAGHSLTEEESGIIHINPTDYLTISDLKYSLRFAVNRGLKLAIFNSCDGLGLARDLADLQIPQIIVMREPVPDTIATEFLKYFLLAFSKGKTLYTAVREAREKLHAKEDQYPCASWLPIIFQNPSEMPLIWDDLRGLSSTITDGKTSLEDLAKLREIFEQNLDLSPLEQANILEQLQALVQIVPMPPSELKQRLGSQALMVIKGTIADLPATSILKHEGQKLLKEIYQEILG